MKNNYNRKVIKFIKVFSKLKIKTKLTLFFFISIPIFIMIIFYSIISSNGFINRIIISKNVSSNISSLDSNFSVTEGSYEVNMNTEWTFSSGTSYSKDAYISNSSYNNYPVYITIELEDSTVIYTSSEIPIGYELDNIKLDIDLDAGIYDTVVIYHLIDDGSEISTVSVSVQITINN